MVIPVTLAEANGSEFESSLFSLPFDLSNCYESCKFLALTKWHIKSLIQGHFFVVL